jgi:hypothetical protein
MLDAEVGDFTRNVSALVLMPDNALNPELVHLLLEPQAEVDVVNAPVELGIGRERASQRRRLSSRRAQRLGRRRTAVRGKAARAEIVGRWV